MKISDFFRQTNLEKTVLIGYYGGGNYGDELLMEVLSNLFKKRGVKDISIMYQTPETFSRFHHDFGYTILPSANKLGMLKAIIKNKTIVIGGGGLWGLDVNKNILILSIILFVSRWLLGKKVYLLGVGYYNSTPRLGHISAFFAAKAANIIFARDREAFGNFSKLSANVKLDVDIAWYLNDIDLTAYKQEADKLEEQLTLSGKTVFMTLRRFKEGYENSYSELVKSYIETNNHRTIILALMEPKEVDPVGYLFAKHIAGENKHVRLLDFAYNPIALFSFFKSHKQNLVFVGPQFHGIISAYLNDIPYFPISYDNKVTELLNTIQPEGSVIELKKVTSAQIQSFVDWASGGEPI